MTSPDFRVLLLRAETARRLADLEAATAGRILTRDETRLMAHLRSRLDTHQTPEMEIPK
jgi:hypothetical protein